jgi:hypothetical protein
VQDETHSAEVTVKELELLSTLAVDQLFRKEFISQVARLQTQPGLAVVKIGG